MKKTLALVLALAMVFSTITVAFAEDTLGADAQVCSNLGMLKGETGTVDAAYVATAPTRLQAAIMFLRLKGLEAEALAFTGTDNFADADQVNWAGGKAIMAFLKANPQYGWVGDAGKLNPNNKITAQEYYKVMLEALGYKQSTPEVVGDFAWADVFTFAASVGLSKVATVANFTVNDLAIATVEALKLNVKGGTKTLAATLVEAGKMDKAAAITAGLYADTATTTAKLDTVSSIGNAVVLVEFDTDVEKAFAENVANYKLVEKATGTAVEVKAAVLDATETTLAVLDTAALTAGKAYTMTVGEVSKNFAGIAKSTAAPEIDTVEGTDTERVTITFTESMDMATALDAANYAIANVTVESVEWDDPDGYRDAVVLTTKGMVANKTYKVTVANVKSTDGVILKSASKNFVSTTDKKAPKIDEDNSKAMTNTRILVTFEDDNEITKESAENLENYKVTLGSGTDELEITAAKLVEDANDDEKAVELTTATQKGSQKYVVHVNNIVDTSVLANKMAKEDKVNVYGKRADDDEPTFKSIEYLSDTLIQVTFSDASRLDFATAQDINNYEVNNDIAVEKAEMFDVDDADCMKVRLTVSELGDKKSYKVTVTNVADEYGNVMEAETKTKTFNKDAVMAVSTVKSIKVTDENTVVLTFTKELIEASAEDVANYEIDDEIGTPRKAVYDDDDKTVTLTTADMVINHKYDLTIDGVKDIAENVLTDVEVDFVVSQYSNDIDAPEIEDIEAVNKHVVRVTYNEAIDVENLTPTITLDIDLTSSTQDNDSDATNESTDDEKINDTTLLANKVVRGTYMVSTDDDDMVLEYFFEDPVTNLAVLSDEDVNLTATTAEDLAGNLCEDTYEFSTTGDDPETVELLSWDQTNVKKFELQFSEKVQLQSGVTTIPGGGYTFTPEVDEDDDSLWYLVANKIMEEDKEFGINISSYFENYHGFIVLDEDDAYNTTFTGIKAATTDHSTTFETGIEDEEEPFIEEVVATDRNNVDITFSEDMGYEGSYKVTYIDDDGDEVTMTNSASDPDDNVVTLTFTNNLSSKYVYTLTVKNQAKDLAGNKLDEDAEYDFAGTDVIAIANYVEGVKVINPWIIKVSTFAKMDPDLTTATVVYGTSNAAVPMSGTPWEDATVGDEANTDLFTFSIAAGYALGKDVDYTVTITDGTDTMSYVFEGVASDDISVIKVTGVAPAPNTYKMTYEDAVATDFVYLNGSVTPLATSNFVNGEWLLPGVADGNIITIAVDRNNNTLYYLNQFDVTDAEN